MLLPPSSVIILILQPLIQLSHCFQFNHEDFFQFNHEDFFHSSFCSLCFCSPKKSYNLINSFLTAHDVVPKNYHQFDLPQVTRPESITFNCKNQGPYVGVSNGRIFKWHGPNIGWKEFVIPSPTRYVYTYYINLHG
ncbi:Uncharacterized protein TCM_011366 [Theobroma cacao]|uniref:Uncharacterized protein n=1 Tax=Theobroma cacao TaxID=3641 RepID=A0A061EAR0_THECC|nr:Uncharacterized protein TCM_011366 [Theobroma cacao]